MRQRVRSCVDDPVEVGDDSITVEITFRSTDPDFDFELEFHAVVWTRDGIVSSLTLSGGLDDDFESTPPERSLLEDLVADADEKLQEVIDEDG